MDGRRLVASFADVPVAADDTGEEYNIEASNFSLPGLVGSPSYTKIYGQSLGAMTGGTAREVAQVTEEDIDSAKSQLTETLKAQAIKNLLAEVPPSFHILEDSLDFAVIEDTSLAKPGVELDEFTYSAKVRAAMTAFHKEDADILVRQLLSAYAGPNQVLYEETLSLAYSLKAPPGATGVLPLQVEASVNQYEKLDKESFLERLKGTSSSQFRQLAGDYPFFAKTRISLWPFWRSTVPSDKARIGLEVVLED